MVANFNNHDMTVAAIFKSRLLKMATEKWLLKEKFIYLCNWAEVVSKIEHAVTT